MESFIIEGGHRLSGTIAPQGAKNEALEVICATLLTTEEVIIRNVPDILDVNNLIRLLQDIGVKVKKLAPNEFSFQADEVNLDYLESSDFVKKCSSLRGSVLMIGPLLGRFGKATIAKPGGDKIGRRRSWRSTHCLGSCHRRGRRSPRGWSRWDPRAAGRAARAWRRGCRHRPRR